MKQNRNRRSQGAKIDQRPTNPNLRGTDGQTGAKGYNIPPTYQSPPQATKTANRAQANPIRPHYIYIGHRNRPTGVQRYTRYRKLVKLQYLSTAPQGIKQSNNYEYKDFFSIV